MALDTEEFHGGVGDAHWDALSTGQKWSIAGGIVSFWMLVLIFALFRSFWRKPRVLDRENQC
jgi:hypothetical protein